MDENTPRKSEHVASTDLTALAADIVSAYVSKNSVPLSDLPVLIGNVHSALSKLGSAPEQVQAELPAPAVSIKKSVTPDFIVCLEDGKKFKSLKRHLRTKYDLTPEQYRARWNLPHEYPMVAPSYAAARSELARNMGLGQQRRKAAKAKRKSA